VRQILFAAAIVGLALAGCFESVPEGILTGAGGTGPDLPMILPQTDFYNATGKPGYLAVETPQPFHTLEEVYGRVMEFQARRPDLVNVTEIGRTLQDRPMYDIVVTNRSVPGPKIVPFFDGGHHGNEIAGTELILYTVDFLLDNYERNATVRRWVDTYEIHLVPLVNPDGYAVQTRGNALGVNLNRNYDIDWGNQGGASNPVMGTLAHALNRSMPSVMIVAENSGPHAFSEPESRAVRDLLASLDDRLAFYMTYHTPTNGFIAPWSAFDPPFAIPPEHNAVFEATLEWVRTNTEYKAGKAQWGNFSAGLPYSASGSSQDWAYMRHNVPAFTLEIEIWYTSVFSDGYAGRVFLTPYQGLDYWMRASLPIPLHLLANADRFAAWEPPVVSPPLPDGVPPERPAALDACTGIPSDEAPNRPVWPLAVCNLVQPEEHEH